MKAIACALIMLANIIGGFSFVAMKFALEDLPHSHGLINLGRTLVALACAGLWMAMTPRRGGKLTAGELGRVLLVGTLCYALPVLLGTIGIDRSTVGNASILILGEPAAILFFSWLLLRQHLRGVQVVAMLLTVAGALWLILGQPDVEYGELIAQRHFTGNVILAVHAVLWGLYSPVLKPVAVNHDPARLVLYVLAAGLLVLVPAALLEGEQLRTLLSPEHRPQLWEGLGWIALLGLVVSFGATFMWNFALRHLPPPAIAPFIFLQPLAGVWAGHWVFDETLGEGTLYGGLIIALGIVGVILGGRRR